MIEEGAVGSVAAVDVVFWSQLLRPRDVEGKVVIVVDVLRATSTMLTALHAGFDAVAVVASVSSARAKARAFPAGSYLFGGERGGVKIPGFSLGNSPLEYLKMNPSEARGKTLIFTTTNGTRAILKTKVADEVLMGAILNARAAARAALTAGKDIVILCAGTEGKFSADDFLTAGLLVERILQEARAAQGTKETRKAGRCGPASSPAGLPSATPFCGGPRKDDASLDLSDSAMVALDYWNANRSRPEAALRACWHGRRMLRLGFAEDIRFCAQVDAFDLVARFDKETGLVVKIGPSL